MIAIELDQGTDKWHMEKLGKPSASNFDKIITTKGEPSKQRAKYLRQLAAERLSGVGEDGFRSKYMDRGNGVEQEARSFYEIVCGSEVKKVGVCYKDDKKRFLCSPDGLVGRDGGLEMKCPSGAVHIEYFEGGGLPTEYFQQVQGSLFITGRKWWDFLSYYPAIKPLIYRVTPDLEFISKLENELNSFCDELDALVLKLS